MQVGLLIPHKAEPKTFLLINCHTGRLASKRLIEIREIICRDEKILLFLAHHEGKNEFYSITSSSFSYSPSGKEEMIFVV